MLLYGHRFSVSAVKKDTSTTGPRKATCSFERRFVSNLLYGQGCPCSSNPPASTLQVLGIRG